MKQAETNLSHYLATPIISAWLYHLCSCNFTSTVDCFNAQSNWLKIGWLTIFRLHLLWSFILNSGPHPCTYWLVANYWLASVNIDLFREMQLKSLPRKVLTNFCVLTTWFFSFFMPWPLCFSLQLLQWPWACCQTILLNLQSFIVVILFLAAPRRCLQLHLSVKSLPYPTLQFI